MTPAQFIDDPRWADFLPEDNDAPKRRHLPTHEDCSPIDPDGVRGHLRRGGTLGAVAGYEERPGQIDMAGALAVAYNSRAHLMVEAGTGVGKSLAYLIPSVIWAATNDTPVVISTATRNLQSQLIGSDIPKALAVLGERRDAFKVALLKGRSNYLCLRAVSEFFAAGFWTLSEEDKKEMPAFIAWLRHTPDGDLDAYEGLSRAVLTCPGEECGGRRCPYYSRCFVYRARKRAAEAHLIVVNHALVLAEATAPSGGVLPSYGRLVLDEAHNLEAVATDYLSRELSLPALTHILNRLRRRRRGKTASSSGILANVERQFNKGAFTGSPVRDGVMRLLQEATRNLVQVVSTTEDLIETASLLLAPASERTAVRFRVEGGTRSYSLHGLFKAYEPEIWREADLARAQTAFDEALAGEVNVLHRLRDALEDAVPEGELNYLGDLAQQVSGIAESLVSFANDANFVLRGENRSYAYWAERVREPRRTGYVRLVAAPLSVADELHRILYDVKDSVVLCSATLRVGNDFKYMARRLGFFPVVDDDPDRYRCLTAESPFDYFRQALVLAPDCLPDPSEAPSDYAAALARMLEGLMGVTNGRALVLFTSYEMMSAVAAAARSVWSDHDLTLLVQGEGLSRETMTRVLKTRDCSSRVVLFGAQSFWEGVDVAGEALSCVVIARLPFAQVGDPVIEARGEKIKNDGGSPFRDYALPEAVIKFRQGFGRLIRTKADRGVVVVTDPRLVTKNYGAVFRRSIPASVHTVVEPRELMDRVRAFFD